MAKKISGLVFLLSILYIALSCGGGGGGGGSSGTVVSGIIEDSTLIGASKARFASTDTLTAVVTNVDNPSLTFLATVESRNYSVTVTPGINLKIQIKNGDTIILSRVLDKESTAAATVSANINVITHVQAQMALANFSAGTDLKAAIKAANKEMFGSDTIVAESALSRSVGLKAMETHNPVFASQVATTGQLISAFNPNSGDSVSTFGSLDTSFTSSTAATVTTNYNVIVNSFSSAAASVFASAFAGAKNSGLVTTAGFTTYQATITNPTVTTAISAPTIDTPAAPAIRFIGRFDHAEPGAARFAWSGSGIAFRFSGTDASVRLNEVGSNTYRLDDKNGEFYTVVVNGQRQSTLATRSGEWSYPVATGLPAGEHEVFLYRRTEAFFGVSSFIALELGSGKLLAPPPPPARRIEIIGDSLTVGFGNDGVLPCTFSAETENHYLTYGAIAARNLNAELITVAASGKGVIRNYGGDPTDPLPKLYDKILPFPFLHTQRLWDFSWQPHVVVINLGTNDFSTPGAPSESAFTNAYKDFIAFLREKYPKAYILCLAPTGFTSALSYIQNVVAARIASGDTNIEAHTLIYQDIGSGCGSHPSKETHASMADALTQKLKSAMRW